MSRHVRTVNMLIASAAALVLIILMAVGQASAYPNLGSNCSACHKTTPAQPAKPTPSEVTKPTKPATPAPSAKPAAPAQEKKQATKPTAPVAQPAAPRSELHLVKINGVARSVELLLFEGTAYFALRDLTKFFRVAPEWDQVEQVAVLPFGQDRVTISLKDGTLAINGEAVKLKNQPRLVNGRLYVPLRECTVVAGGKVHYDPLWGITVEIPNLTVVRASQ